MQTKIFAPYWGFFSTGHFAGHERKFGRDFKGILSEPYREFESRLVRQEVIDIIKRIGRLGIYATFPTVTVLICESSQLRAQISPHFRDQRGQFSERHFANAVLVAMMVRSDLMRPTRISVGVQFQNLERFFVIDRSGIVDVGDEESGQRGIVQHL